jgi:type VI protein secretion system component VasK
MWRSKKFIIIAVLAAVILAGTIGGVALAQTGDDNTSKAQAKVTALLDKVAEIYQKNTGTAIDSAELQKAITEAGKALRDEAFDKYLQGLVASGKITQEQADQYKNWLNAKPDVPLPFDKNNGGGLMPFGGMHRGFGGPDGGFRGWCAPDTSDNVTNE